MPKTWLLWIPAMMVLFVAAVLVERSHEERHPRPLSAQELGIEGWTQHDLARDCVSRARWIAENHEQHKEACKRALELIRLVGFVSETSMWREVEEIACSEAGKLTYGIGPRWPDLRNSIARLSKTLENCRDTDIEFHDQMVQLPLQIDNLKLDEQEDFGVAADAAAMMKRAVEVHRTTGNSFPLAVARFAERRARAVMTIRREALLNRLALEMHDESALSEIDQVRRERDRLEREAAELRARAESSYIASYETPLESETLARDTNLAVVRALKRSGCMSAPAMASDGAVAGSSPKRRGALALTPPPARDAQADRPQLQGPVISLFRRITVSGASVVIFSHDGDKFVVMSNPPDNHRQNVWLDCFSMDTGRRLFRVYNGDSELNAEQAVFSPDDRIIYHQRRSRNGYSDIGPCAISAITGREIWWRKKERNYTGGLAASPDGRYLVAADRDCLSGDQYVAGCVYRASSGRTEAKLRKAKLGYAGFVFSPKGSFMAEQTGEGLRVVGTDDWTLRYAHPIVTSLLGNCRGGFAGTAEWGMECQLLIMDWATGKMIARHHVPDLVTVSPSLKWYVKGDAETGVEIRSLPADQPLQRLPPDPNGWYINGLSEDGRWLAICEGDDVLIFRTNDEYM